MAKNIRLITARLRNDLKAWELAAELKINPNTYSMYECGRKKPDNRMKRLIAEKLGVTAEDIF